jgi:hypothetical protein
VDEVDDVDEEQAMNDRIERLRSDAAGLNVRRSGARDGLYQAIGAVAMAAGVVFAFVAYQLSLSKDDSRDIQSLQILALAMLALAIVGAAVFLRYSIARFLRFWLLRQLYEGQAHVEQVVAALQQGEGAAGPAGATTPTATVTATERRDQEPVT